MNIPVLSDTVTIKTKKVHSSNQIPAKIIVFKTTNLNTHQIAVILNQTLPNLSINKAEELALEVLVNGSVIVWQGDLELAEAYTQELINKGLKASVDY